MNIFLHILFLESGFPVQFISLQYWNFDFDIYSDLPLPTMYQQIFTYHTPNFIEVWWIFSGL